MLHLFCLLVLFLEVSSFSKHGIDIAPVRLTSEQVNLQTRVEVQEGVVLFNISYPPEVEDDESWQGFRTAFERAVRIWASLLNNDRTIDVEVISGELTGDLLLSLSAQPYSLSYADLLEILQSQDGMQDVQPWDSFPASSDSLSEFMQFPEGISWDGQVLIAAPIVQPFIIPAEAAERVEEVVLYVTVDASHFSKYDFDNSDGTMRDRWDGMSTILHMIGHGLGFQSAVDAINMETQTRAEATSLYVWDLLRFAAKTPANFENTKRQYDDNANQYYFDPSLATGVDLNRGLQVTTWTADHWLERGWSGVFGIMDPKFEKGQQVGISTNDMAVLETIGWSLKAAPVPMLDSFVLDQAARTVKVMGYLLTKGARCRFNDQNGYITRPSDTLEQNTWRGVTCAISSALHIGAQNIIVRVSNDGITWSNSLQISSDVVTISRVSPVTIPLYGYRADIQVTGQLFSMEESQQYKCSVAGSNFNATVMSSTSLSCALNFSTLTGPGPKRAYNLTVLRGTRRSNVLTVYFSYPPYITAGTAEGTKLRLTGENFATTTQYCEYRNGSRRLASRVSSTTLTCEYEATADASTVDVRIYASGMVGNWFTVVLKRA